MNQTKDNDLEAQVNVVLSNICPQHNVC